MQSFIGFVSMDAVLSFLLLGWPSHGSAPSDRAYVSQGALPGPPIARGPPLILEAVNDPHSGKGSFRYNDREIAPVIMSPPVKLFGSTIAKPHVPSLHRAVRQLTMHEYD